MINRSRVRLPAMRCRVSTWMGYRQWAGNRGKLSRYVTGHLRELSLPSLRGRLIEYRPVAGIKAGCVHLGRVAILFFVTSAGCLLTHRARIQHWVAVCAFTFVLIICIVCAVTPNNASNCGTNIGLTFERTGVRLGVRYSGLSPIVQL